MTYPCGHSCVTEPAPDRCPLCHKSRRHKYGAKPVRCQQHGYFMSTGEYLRYLVLYRLFESGVIKELDRQATYWIESIKQSAKWDYRYKEEIDGQWKTVVEDYKGCKTREYLRKKKWFIHDYPDIVFRETQAKVYAKSKRRRQAGKRTRATGGSRARASRTRRSGGL